MTQYSKKLMFLIAPPSEAYSSKDIQSLRRNLNNTGTTWSLIGDSNTDLSLPKIENSFQEFYTSQVPKDQQADVTIIMFGECMTSSANHSYLRLYKNGPAPSIRIGHILDSIINVTNANNTNGSEDADDGEYIEGNSRIDVFVAAGDSYSALQDCGILPGGCCMITNNTQALRSDKPICHSNIDHSQVSDIGNILPCCLVTSAKIAFEGVARGIKKAGKAFKGNPENSHLSILLKSYLAYGLQVVIPPAMSKSGTSTNGEYSDQLRLAHHLGEKGKKSFTKAERLSVYNAYDTVFGGERVDEILAETETKNRMVPAEIYGASCAFLLELRSLKSYLP